MFPNTCKILVYRLFTRPKLNVNVLGTSKNRVHFALKQ